MTDLVLHEKEMVRGILSDCSKKACTHKAVFEVVKYYLSEGYDRAGVEEKTKEFICKCDSYANMSAWSNFIDDAVKLAKNSRMVDLDGIDITAGEFNAITSLEGDMRRKLMFTILCIAKYFNAINEGNNNWVNQKQKDIFTMANIKVTSKRQSLLINDLWRAGLIGYSRVVDNININVKIVNNDSEVRLTVTDFRNLGNQYQMFCGGRFMICQECGAVIRRESNAQKCCKECSSALRAKRYISDYKSRAAS